MTPRERRWSTGWRWELVAAGDALRGLAVALACAAAFLLMAGFQPVPDMPPLPAGYVCGPADLDLRCPAGQAMSRAR